MDIQKKPFLRFPEFDGEWTLKKLKDRCAFFSGGTPTSTNKEYYNGNIPFIGSGNIFDDKVDKFITEEALLNSSAKIVDKGDILYALYGANSGDVSLSKINGAINQAILCIRTKEDKAFLHQLLSHKKNSIVSTYLQGGQGNLSSDIIKKLKFYFPNFQEQQKISSFLSDLDEAITKLSKKKTFLEQYKKGVMQKIFRQELRFKDDEGNDFPKWEYKKLGLIGSIISGLTYSPNDIDENGVLVLRSSNVKKRLIALNDNVFVNVEEGKFNPVELNDILICVRNGSKRLIGKNAIIKEKHIGLAFGAFMTVYRSAYNQFLFHFFDSQHYKKEVHKNLGATINSINGSDLKKFKVPFPCIEEQNKIASFLSDIDLKIETLAINIKKTKSLKKGLLQKMFI